MTADEVKEALRRRHPAEQFMGSRKIPGPWTTIEEYRGIDLLAVSAHANPTSGAVPGVRYPRVGYEVKVSRSDYRREILRPSKRAASVAWCNAFFFAVPAGLLTAEEVAFVEPEWEPGDFTRTACPPPCVRGTRARFIGPLRRGYVYRPYVEYPCAVCGGRGYVEPSRVERDAPTLWIPRDVGLITIDGRGCHVVRRAPVRKDVAGIDAGLGLADLVRWVSVRPDPRHRVLGEREREVA